MNSRALALPAIAAAMGLAQSALAIPLGGFTYGGPPAMVLAHVPQDAPRPPALSDAAAAGKSAAPGFADAADPAMTGYTDLVARDLSALTAAREDLGGAEDALTALRNSGTATPQQLADAEAAAVDAQSALHAAAVRLTTDEASPTAAPSKSVSAQTAPAARQTGL